MMDIFSPTSQIWTFVGTVITILMLGMWLLLVYEFFHLSSSQNMQSGARKLTVLFQHLFAAVLVTIAASILGDFWYLTDHSVPTHGALELMLNGVPGLLVCIAQYRLLSAMRGFR